MTDVAPPENPPELIFEVEPDGSKPCAKAFTDPHGNTFILPSMIIWPERLIPEHLKHRRQPSREQAFFQALEFATIIGVTAEQHWFVFDHESFQHVSIDLAHPRLLTGMTTVFMIAGPEFETIKNRPLQPESEPAD